jgi:kinesin family member 11
VFSPANAAEKKSTAGAKGLLHIRGEESVVVESA